MLRTTFAQLDPARRYKDDSCEIEDVSIDCVAMEGVEMQLTIQPSEVDSDVPVRSLRRRPSCEADFVYEDFEPAV